MFGGMLLGAGAWGAYADYAGRRYEVQQMCNVGWGGGWGGGHTFQSRCMGSIYNYAGRRYRVQNMRVVGKGMCGGVGMLFIIHLHASGSRCSTHNSLQVSHGPQLTKADVAACNSTKGLQRVYKGG